MKVSSETRRFKAQGKNEIQLQLNSTRTAPDREVRHGGGGGVDAAHLQRRRGVALQVEI
jgi:hypothetical protein